MDEMIMPSLIVATLSLDDMATVRPSMRPPLTWVTVWNMRGLASWRQTAEFREIFDTLTL